MLDREDKAGTQASFFLSHKMKVSCVVVQNGSSCKRSTSFLRSFVRRCFIR
jgi:hypothetical protein